MGSWIHKFKSRLMSHFGVGQHPVVGAIKEFDIARIVAAIHAPTFAVAAFHAMADKILPGRLNLAALICFSTNVIETIGAELELLAGNLKGVDSREVRQRREPVLKQASLNSFYVEGVPIVGDYHNVG